MVCVLQRLPVDNLGVLLFSGGYDAWGLSSSLSHIDVDIIGLWVLHDHSPPLHILGFIVITLYYIVLWILSV